MTQPGGHGSNDINLAALWIPVMPETSHMGEEMRKAGRESKRQFEEGFNSGSSPEAMGQSFGARFNTSVAQAFSKVEAPFGLSKWADKMGGEIDEKLLSKLKGEASQALSKYRTEYDNLTAAQQRAAEAESKVSVAREQGFNKASIMLPLLKEQTAAQKELEGANTRTGAALEDYNGKVGRLSEVTRGAAGSSATLAGMMGGAVVGGVMMATGAIESFYEHMIEGVVEAFKMGVEGAKEFADTMLEIGEAYHHIGVQVTEFSAASGEQFEELEHHAQAVFGQIDVAGKDVGKTMAQFASMLDAEPGPALDRLTAHVTELQGRFSTLKSGDLASIFVAFKTPVGEADAALASLLQSARNSGQDLGQLTSALSGDAAVTLQQAGLNIQQAGAFMGELLKLGAPGRSVMMGLQSAMKEFGKDGLSFSEGMQLAGTRLKELGDTAAGQDLAEKLFGTRRWAVAMQAAQDYIDVVEKGPEAFNSSGAAVDDFITRTRTLQNEWELVKHRAQEAFLPMGEQAVKLAGAGLDHLLKFVNEHMDQIHHVITQGGLYIIQAARDVQLFGQGVLEFFAPITDVVVNLIYAAVESLAGFSKAAGAVLEHIPGMRDIGHGLSDAGTAAGHFGDTLKNLQVGDKMRDLAQWSKDHPIDVKKAGDSWIDFADEVSDSMDRASGAVRDHPLVGSAVSPNGMPVPGGGPGIGAAAGFPTPGAPPGGGPFIGGSAAGPASSDQKGIATAIFNAVKSAGYSDETALTAVAAAMHESSLNPGAENHEKGLHESLFQTSGDKGVGKDPNAQVAWFLGKLHELGGPPVIDADPANIIADKVEVGGYSGSVFDIAGARRLLGMQKGGYPVTRGSGAEDDQPALLTKGEYVWDKETMGKWGWLVKALHSGVLGFDSGGPVGGDLDTQGAQADTIAVAKAAEAMFGIGGANIGMYRSPDGYNEHASGQAADIMVYKDQALGNAVAQYFLQNAGAFGVQYVLWQQTQWNPDGSSSKMPDRGGITANHFDHVHVRTLGGGFPSGKAGPGYAAPKGGDYSAMPSAVAQYAVGGGGDIPPGPTGPQFPGIPGQYGGYGAYGGETYDQQRQAEKSLQDAKDRAADLDYQIGQNQKRINDIKEQIAQVGVSDKTSPLTGKPYPLTPDEQRAADEKRKTLNDQLDEATHQLTVSQRERSEQDGNISDAQRKQIESMYRKPKGGAAPQEYKVPGVSEFSQLGGAFLSGIGQELGFGDLFAKPPWEWGAVKLLTGGLNWAMGTANAWADEIGKGHTGMTGFQPIEGFEQQGSAGLTGLLSGLGLNIPMPKPQIVDQFGRPVGTVSSGPNVVATQQPPGPFGPPTGPPPGPVVQGDYMPINVSPNVNPSAILGPVQEQRNSQNATLHGYTGGLPQ